MEKIKRIFEKNGMAKLFGSAILGLFFYWLFYSTGLSVWKWLSFPFAIYFALAAIILFTYAWIINPIKSIKKKKS